jgi:hypothetical protein
VRREPHHQPDGQDEDDHFDFWALHVWAWRRNPAGLFADWNPNLEC